MFRRVAVAGLVLCVAGFASAGSTVSLFKAVSGLPCTTMERNLAALQTVSGVYSLAISGRATQYEAMETNLAALHSVDVPYAGQDLSPQPLVQPTGLQNAYKKVPHTVADPNWAAASMPLLVGIAGTAGAVLDYVGTPQFQSPDWSGIGKMGALGVLGLGVGIYFLTGTRTVYKSVYDPAAAAANSRIMATVKQENESISARNAKVKMELDQRNAAIAKNQEIVSERSSLVARMGAYEAESKSLALQQISSLSTEEDRRCLDRLVYESSAIKLGAQRSRVYLIVRPLNPDGETLPNALGNEISFGVRSISVSDPIGIVANAGRPSLFAVVSAAAAPITINYPSSFIALEFDVPMSRDVANKAAKLSVNAEIDAVQDGKQITATVHGSIVPLP